MLIRNCNPLTLSLACKDVGVTFAYDPRAAEGGLRVRFVPQRDEDYHREHGHYRYQRRSAGMFHTERRIHALCWHGYRKLFRRIFELCPDAQIITALARRCGIKSGKYTASTFEADFPATGLLNIGCQAMPVQAREACFCSDTFDDYDDGPRAVQTAKVDAQ